MSKNKVDELPELEIQFLDPKDGEGKYTILTKPLKVGDKPLKEIHVPVKCTGELEKLAVALGDVNSMPDLCAAYCGIDLRIVKALAIEDFEVLQEDVLDFLPRSIRENVQSAKAVAMDEAMANQHSA